MDKWDEMAEKIARAALANEPEAALHQALKFIGELGRTAEQISADLDRIATAMEKGQPS